MKRTRDHERENDACRTGLPRAPSGGAVSVTALTPVADPPLHRALGLTDAEHERILSLLGREPNRVELAIFSLLWSEHCAYKHSARLLKRLPSTGERVLQGPGENAGAVDLGDGEAVVFKVESHNHPSAVEPFQGAATGVGGILRDVVAMGARPIALLDGLYFGAPDYAFRRAVSGIGMYGNCVGVPTVGGDTCFDVGYADNCLVNAMCVGIVPTERLTRARADVPGRLVLLIGAATGRDGIGGASVLASQELGEGADEKRPSVQIGDPFTGKKLIEASVELAERGLVESLQDCGAAGLASALSEMAADGAGIDVHLDRVPLREPDLEPWEIAISESQERMVAVVRPTMAAAVAEVCARWEVPCTPIGTVTGGDELRCLAGDVVVAEIPARLLTDAAPRYAVARAAPDRWAERPALPVGLSAPEVLVALLATPNLGRKAWIYERYDHLVGSRTVRRPGFGAAVLRLRPALRGLAVSLDGPPGAARLDPWTAGAQAVLAAARNVACAGGEPLALTDCLNFGNPEKPEIGRQLAEAIDGLAAAAEALGVPVVSGNVSLYNETDGRPIPPTPVVGCVGLVPDVRFAPSRWQEGDVLLLAGSPRLTLDGSAYQALAGDRAGRPAPLDLTAEAALVRFLWKAAPLLTLAHDAGEGGLAVCLAEAALESGVGARLEIDGDDPLALFGEGGGQAVLACAPADVPRLGSRGLRRIGRAGGDELLGIPLAELAAARERS